MSRCFVHCAAKEISVKGIVIADLFESIKTNCINAFPLLGNLSKVVILLLISNCIDSTSFNEKLDKLSEIVLFGVPQVSCLSLSPIIE